MPSRRTERAQDLHLPFTTPAGKRARLSLRPVSKHGIGTRPHARDRGAGPSRERGRSRGQGAHTVRELVTRYTEKHASTLRSGKAIERRLTKNVLPILGDRPIEGLHKRDVNRVLDPIITRGAAVEAARCFETCGRCAAGPYRGATSIIRRWKVCGSRRRQRHATTCCPILSSRSCGAGCPRRCRARSRVSRVVKLCLLTAQRVGEVAGLRAPSSTSELGLGAKPSSRSKNEHAHTVPLSDAAIAPIKEARGETFLFSRQWSRRAPSARGRAYDPARARAVRAPSVDDDIYGGLPSPAWRTRRATNRARPVIDHERDEGRWSRSASMSNTTTRARRVCARAMGREGRRYCRRGAKVVPLRARR